MTPHTTTGTVCNAMHDWHMPGHHDLSAALAVFGAVVRKAGALTEAARKQTMELLDDAMDVIDQDLRNQQAEQAWGEQETRAAGFGISPADRFIAASIAGIRKQPLEVK